MDQAANNFMKNIETDTLCNSLEIVLIVDIWIDENNIYFASYVIQIAMLICEI